MPLFYVLQAEDFVSLGHGPIEDVRAALLRPALLNPYHLVAVVASPSLDDVFELTNSYSHAWQDNAEVLACTHYARSTSAGDVAIAADTGEPNACRPMGWEAVPGLTIRFELVGADIPADDQTRTVPTLFPGKSLDSVIRVIVEPTTR